MKLSYVSFTAALLVASTNAQHQLRRKLQGGAPGVGELECGDHPTDPDAQLCSFGLPKVLGANGNQPVPTYCGEYSCVNIPSGITTTPLPRDQDQGGSAACSAHSSCGSLQGQCCPTTNGGYLDCCDKGGSTPAAAPVPAPAPVPFIAQNDGITNSNTPGTPGSLAGGGQTITTTDGQGVQATFAVNPEGLCISNGIGGTCTNSAFPSIACCTDSVTGAFFNGCCVQGFQGMILGDQDNDGNPNEFDVIIAPTDQYGFPPEDYDYDSGYDDVLDGSRDNGDEVTTPVVILTAEQLEIWRNENGISGDEGDCEFCNYPGYNCHTGMPAPPDENPKCNNGNYQCQYYTNCGVLPGNRPQPNAVTADESQCQKCYSRGCPTGRPSTNLDANDRDVCSYNHCPDYANCEHDYPCSDYYKNCASVPRTQGGTEVVYSNGRGGYAGRGQNGRGYGNGYGGYGNGYGNGVEEKTGRSSKVGKAY